MNEIALVVPNWNGETHLRRFFDSLNQQTLQPARVLIVDNGSTDGSASLARSRGHEVLTLPRNLGFAPAVNRGIAATSEPLIGIFNNDVALAPDYLARLGETLAATNVNFATGKIFQSNRENVLDATWDLVSRSGLPWRAGHGRPDSPLWNRPREIASAPLTAALFRRSVFDQIGNLDERFESYLEDVDFGLRCALAGLSGRFVPEAAAWHWGSATLGVWRAETVRLQSRNQLLLAAKHFPRNWIRPLARPLLAGQLLWGLLALRNRRFTPWFRGKVEALRQWSGVRQTVPSGSEKVPALLAQFEREILDLQRETGCDRFWMWYRQVAGDV